MIRNLFAGILGLALVGVHPALARQPPGAEVSGNSATDVTRQNQKIANSNWPQFRGFQGSGMGSGNPPAEWNIESGKNILWKRPLDGLGHSGPIAFGNRIFLTTAVSEQKRQSIPTGQVGGNGESASDAGNWRWQVAAFDLGTGVEIWRRTVATGVPTIKRHIKATHANSTPATDGRHVVAFFGSEGLYCLDVDGNLLWEKHFGKLHSGPYDAPQLEWGFASSPIIHDGCVILQCDCLNTGFVSILKVSDGQEIRRIKRNDVATWSTPAVIQTETETQLICNGYREMAGYNLRTGEQLWTIQGGGDVPVPTPLTAQGLILLTNGHGRSPIYAVSPSARGNLTPAQNSDRLPTGLVWWQPRGGTYIPTPIIAGDFLYLFSSPGVLTARETRTGRLVYRQRAGGQCSASAVASSSHLYLCSETGTVSVIRTGSDYELSAHNEMQAPVFATPAIVRNRLLIRTTRNLYAIGTAESQPMP